MQIVFQVSPDRRRWVRATRRAMRPYGTVVWVGCLIIMLGGVTITVLDPADPQGVVFIVLGLVMLVLGLSLPWLAVRMQGWLLDSPTTVTVTAEKLSSRSADVSAEIAWSTVRRVQETPEMWLVRPGRTHMLMLPKDGTDEAGRREFQRLLVERGLAR
ncbi:YcxB family protein [Micromonospora sp. WMMD1102]|uniref:YcxB family protein n=1 Tax=Micromonospora sp. WMMD1102 TaxID=3016105 RepID=UPI0024154831|nr:YcxB family protein [Micromonospora sp. WMMD1102]MDG4790543.1 YcxB family protein [Micromonospora sp. WMMD1102]